MSQDTCENIATHSHLFALSDPHPGNVLLLRSEDGSPQLGLIDYGSTGKLSKEKRHLMCKLIIALAEEDREAIVRLMKEAG